MLYNICNNLLLNADIGTKRVFLISISSVGMLGWLAIAACFMVFLCRHISYYPENEDIKWGECSNCLARVNLLAIHCTQCGHRAFGLSFCALMMLSALGAMVAYVQYGFSLNTLLLCLLIVCGIIIIITDCLYYVIPDVIHAAIAAIGLFYVYLNNGSILHGMLSGITCFAIGLALFLYYLLIRKKEGLGFGDVKLMGAIGIFLTYHGIFFWLFVSGIFGLLSFICWSLVSKDKFFPFGPALFCGAILMLLFPEYFNKAACFVFAPYYFY